MALSKKQFAQLMADNPGKSEDEYVQMALQAEIKPMPSHGEVVPGNINLYGQPSVPNPETGGMSTVYSFGTNLGDGAETVLPRVAPDGRFMSEPGAVDEYKKTGRHLGKFKDIASASLRAEKIHNDYAAGKYASGMSGILPLPSHKR